MKRDKKGPAPAQKRAVIYRRVSTQEQARGTRFGPDIQLHDCTAYCTQHDYPITQVIDDIPASGTKTIEQRPGLQYAFELCEAGGADLIIAYAQDRLARKGGVLDAIIDRARQHAIAIETVRERQDITEVENELPVEIQSFAANIERILITKRLRSGRQEKASKNGHATGFLNWGYKFDETGVIIVDYIPSVIIGCLFALRDSGRTMQGVANGLNEAGYQTRTGQSWTISSVQAILKHEKLYRSGIKEWAGIEGQERWPIIAHPHK